MIEKHTSCSVTGRYTHNLHCASNKVNTYRHNDYRKAVHICCDTKASNNVDWLIICEAQSYGNPTNTHHKSFLWKEIKQESRLKILLERRLLDSNNVTAIWEKWFEKLTSQNPSAKPGSNLMFVVYLQRSTLNSSLLWRSKVPLWSVSTATRCLLPSVHVFTNQLLFQHSKQNYYYFFFYQERFQFHHSLHADVHMCARMRTSCKVWKATLLKSLEDLWIVRVTRAIFLYAKMKHALYWFQ